MSRPLKIFIIFIELLVFAALAAALVLRQDHYLSMRGPRPHVVIFLVDTLRADHLGCYGHEIPTSPFIDKTAETGVIFHNCRSQAPWTKPSVASLFTSLHSSAHKVISFPKSRGPVINQDIGRYDLLPEQIVTLAEIMRDQGYRTACFTANRWVDRVFGFQQGFDDFFELATSLPPRADGTRQVVPNMPADYLHKKLAEFLAQKRPAEWERYLEKIGIYKKPLFLYLHYMDVHGPYHPPEPFKRMFDRIYLSLPDRTLSQTEIENMDYLYQDVNNLNFYLSRYDAQIRFFDHELERFLDWLQAENLLEPAIMVLTADHGESIGEHGSFDHGNTLYEPEIRIPLIIWGTEDFPPGAVVRDPVRMIDVAPTLLEALKIKRPAQFEGISLMDAINGRAHPDLRIFSENYAHGNSQIAEVRGNQKWIYEVRDDRLAEFYDLSSDPGETTNLIGSIAEKEITARKDELSSWRLEEADRIKIEGVVPKAQMTEEMRRQLEALGYLKPGK